MLLGPAERVTSRWVVDLSGAVWVRAKSLQGRRTATSAHRQIRSCLVDRPLSRSRDADRTMLSDSRRSTAPSNEQEARQSLPSTQGRWCVDRLRPPVAQDAAEGLYRLVDAAYEKRSVAISSNLHPAAFDELMPKTLATATVDRLLHHAHICQTTGESVRLSQALAGQGVSPLN